ncbi:uncharacterized protein EI97DRAFT_436760 [Westerdykella ornata]|uniref:CENP-V/GFA domain-containing protein n=1 Tax=Westerdykella ornata TaxID=318751 RepID=A0A6A6J7X3_WESOR|nr:uncharacterized protein EI97DRAFT_436760 [Westerdykella ornata]KAF2272680.1 hypothetical protein EI97DRAFT_436760 [Westerdykella ornata]
MPQARCNCGAITVEAASAPKDPILCYCSNCQRSSAGLCSVNYIFQKPDVQIHDPSGALRSYRDGDTRSGNVLTRQFCGVCGSPVSTLLSDDSPIIVIKAGLFDGPLPEPIDEVWTESKAAWMKIVKQERGERAMLS